MITARIFDQDEPYAGTTFIDAAAVVLVRQCVRPCRWQAPSVEVCAVTVLGGETVWLQDKDREVSDAILAVKCASESA